MGREYKYLLSIKVVNLKEIISRIIEEDVGFGDITTNALVGKNKITKARIISRENGLIAGVEVIKEIFFEYGIKILTLKDDGEKIAINDIIIEIEGNARKILKLERIILNILMRMSAIATTTNKIIKEVRKVNKKIKIAGTRKTSPGIGFLDKEAIKIGGGDTHRFSLDDLILIKDNHISIVGSLEKAVKLANENASFTKKIEVEIENFEDVLKIASDVDIIMLDNMDVHEINQTIKILKDENLRYNLIIEASGGITPENIIHYGKTDLDIISLGFITHSTKNLDLSLEIVED